MKEIRNRMLREKKNKKTITFWVWFFRVTIVFTFWWLIAYIIQKLYVLDVFEIRVIEIDSCTTGFYNNNNYDNLFNIEYFYLGDESWTIKYHYFGCWWNLEPGHFRQLIWKSIGNLLNLLNLNEEEN